MFDKHLNYLSFPTQDLERCHSILWALKRDKNMNIEHVSYQKKFKLVSHDHRTKIEINKCSSWVHNNNKWGLTDTPILNNNITP